MKEKILSLLKMSEGFVSGQEISEQFGVSRTAIWKVIRQLQDTGYRIEAVRNRGYRLLSEPDLMSQDKIASQLHTDWAGSSLLVLDEVDSTNNEAKRQAESGASHGLLVVSESQSAGRGRRGRTWQSESGESIYMTLLLKPDIEPGNASMLTLVMAMAVRRAFETVGVQAQIKWPNDIICDGKKMVGILTEMSAQMDCINHIVIGTGLNVNNTAFSGELKDRATSVYLQTGQKCDRAVLLAEVLRQFEDCYALYLKSQDLQELRSEYNEHLVNRNQAVKVLDPKDEFEGTALGINERGELLVLTGEGTKHVSAGEVSVRGVYGYV